MKILITENQLEKLIDKYISKEMGDLREEIDHDDQDLAIDWYNINNNKVARIIGGEFLINPDIWMSVQNVFHLHYPETAKAFEKWFLIHTEDIFGDSIDYHIAPWDDDDFFINDYQEFN